MGGKGKFPSIQTIAELIEDIFCGMLYQEESARAQCKKLMKAKRRKKIDRGELLAKLGIDNTRFDETLRKAIEEAERRL